MTSVEQQVASAIRPLAGQFPEDALAELRRRLQAARWRDVHVLREALGAV
jgi:hypothetical protein